MKYLYVGLGLLLLCLALCLTTSLLLRQYVDETAALLEEAQSAAEGGDFWEAADLSQQAMEQWQQHSGFFGLILCHAETDEANATFRRLCRYAQNASEEEFAPTCADLTERIRHIAEMEWPYYYNVL